MSERDAADVELRARFAALAAEDARAAPRFAVPRVGRVRRVVSRPLAAAATAVLMAGAGYTWWATRPRAAAPYPIDLASVTWTAPTDFLLDTPGLGLLRDVPSFTAGTGAAGRIAPALTDDTVRRTPS
ncbi:MAG: hypothetical protein OEY20_07070 [Gemmatimonadota bacterium]|nr:hypothetical protein [Gemmatimonadota bacterium]